MHAMLVCGSVFTVCYDSAQRSPNHSVTPVTSAQIVSAEEVTEGLFKISGKEIGTVSGR